MQQNKRIKNGQYVMKCVIYGQIMVSMFAYCKLLDTLILRNSSRIVSLGNKNAFTGTPIEKGTGYIYVPAALIDEYKTATNWTTFAN